MSDAVGKKLLPSESLRSCVMLPRAVVSCAMEVLLTCIVMALRLCGAWRWSKRTCECRKKNEERGKGGRGMGEE